MYTLLLPSPVLTATGVQELGRGRRVGRPACVHDCTYVRGRSRQDRREMRQLHSMVNLDRMKHNQHDMIDTKDQTDFKS
jgi:hypothetical protein